MIQPITVTTPTQTPQSAQQTGDKKHITRHRLTESEKKTVMALYQQYGENCWDKVQKALNLKTKRTAREHFYKFILADSRTPFTPDEDNLIIAKVNEIGTKWSQIAKLFKNRSDINIRNRYRILARKMMQGKLVPPQMTDMKLSSPPVLNGGQDTVTTTHQGTNPTKVVYLSLHSDILMHISDINNITNDDFFSKFCFKI